MADNNAAAEELALRAYLYAGGELTDSERDAFEERLSQDQSARDALAEAVRMSALLAETAPRPDPAYRERVRQRLHPSWWRRLLARRNYRGHPLFWIMTGTAAALLLSLTALRPEPEVRIIDNPVVQSPTATKEPADEALQDAAFIWAELNTAEHAVKAQAEETLRKSRVEDRRHTRRNMNPATDQ